MVAIVKRFAHEEKQIADVCKPLVPDEKLSAWFGKF